MPPVPAPAPFTDADYEMIAAAVLETARGRWFLAEHARRNRHADTKLVLEAIEKLERTIAHRPEMPESDRMRVDLVEMMKAISRTKAEVAALQPSDSDSSHFDQASIELDQIVEATEKATSDILAAAERVQEIAWTLREQGVDAAVCDLIDAQATEVYQACGFQDITGQRTRKVIEVLRFLEARINNMVRIWRLNEFAAVPADSGVPDAPEVRGAQDSADRLQQQNVDTLLGNERKPDVFWREAQVTSSTERNLGEFDLDDLVVYEANAEAELRMNRREVVVEKDLVVRDIPNEPRAVPAAPAAGSVGNMWELPQPAAKPAAPAPEANAPSVQPSGKEEAKIESLTYAERLALFG